MGGHNYGDGGDVGNGDGMDDSLEDGGWEEIEEKIGICFLPSAFSWSDDLRHVLSPIKDGSGAGKCGGGRYEDDNNNSVEIMYSMEDGLDDGKWEKI